MKLKVLVTGANGFAGSHILESLAKMKNVSAIAACRDKTKLPDWFQGEVRTGDLRDPAYLSSLVRDVDVICHAAAWTAVWNHAKISQKLFLQPSLALIDAALAAGVKKFVFLNTVSAAAPETSSDANSPGISKNLWPHLENVIKIENYLRSHACDRFRVVNIRAGHFIGKNYSLGILPLLLPRLKTHLVPYVNGGKTGMPLVDGEDVGQAFALAATTDLKSNYEGFNIVGSEIPTVRQVIEFLHEEYGYPKPHFSVPFFIAYPFAWLMEQISRIFPFDPLVTRSIILLLEETGVDNSRANRFLGYQPSVHWKESIRKQVAEMEIRQIKPMKMAREVYNV